MTPCGIMADDFIDDIFKIQCELFHCQVLTLWAAKGWGGDCVTPAGSLGLPLVLSATSTYLNSSLLPHGSQTTATEISHHKGQGDLVILEL